MILALALGLSLLAAPAIATIAPARVTLTPPEVPLTPHQALTADTLISIIPSGAMTFAPGHTLQLETDLLGPRWNTVVLTDGIPADRESAEGSVMFINGYVLSYQTNRDVSLEVTVSGTVPDGTSRATVLRVQELDNSGTPVPGSLITITEQVSVAAPSMAVTPFPATTITLPYPSPSPSPAPTRAGGSAWIAALTAAGTVAWAGQRKRP